MTTVTITVAADGIAFDRKIKVRTLSKDGEAVGEETISGAAGGEVEIDVDENTTFEITQEHDLDAEPYP